MASSNHVLQQQSRSRWAVAFGGLVALLLGLVVFVTLGTPILQYMTELGADALVAAIMALTPP